MEKASVKNVFSMTPQVGLRVVRGPDWKWVCIILYLTVIPEIVSVKFF